MAAANRLDIPPIHVYVLCAFLAITAVLIYGQSRNYSRALDDHLIFESMDRIPSDLSGFGKIIRSRYNISEYRPVTMASFQLERIITGKLSSGQTHILNLIIYIATLWLMVFLMMEVVPIQDPVKSKNKYAAFFLVVAVVVIFCVHPIHANVVSSTKNRDSLLSMFFLIAAMLVLFRMIRNKFTGRQLLLFAIYYFLAYYSKRDAIGLVILAPMAVFLFSPKKWPFAIISFLICIGINTTYFWARIYIAPAPEIFNFLDIIEFSENPMGADLASRISAVFSTVLLYMKAYVYPMDYLFYFGFDVFEFPFQGGLLIAGIFTTLSLLTVCIMAVFSRWKNRLLAFALLFMGVNLIYCLNYIDPVAGIYAARLAYISSFGFCLALAILINFIPNDLMKLMLMLILIVVLGFLSHDRSKDWRNFESLVKADIPKLENSHEANRIAGEVFSGIADTIANAEKSQAYYRLAAKHLSHANSIYGGGWKANYREGYAWYRLGNTQLAIEKLERSVELNTQFNSIIVEMLGDAYLFTKDYELARNSYIRIWKNNRNKPHILYKISRVYYDQGNFEGARNFNDSLIVADPGLYPPYENLGLLELRDGDTSSAIEYYRKALSNGLRDPQIEAMVKRYED